jgi:hypothetical protein
VDNSTYRFLQIPLDNGECTRIDCVLHDEPAQSLLVLGVHLTRFDELGFEFGDGFGLGLGVEVHDDCVDHFEPIRCL